jgi:glutathione S-transferase
VAGESVSSKLKLEGDPMLTIYGDSKSGNCLKTKWVADYLDRPFEWIEIDILKNESRTPEYLAMNPAGQVPLAILEDGRPLAQSNAIMLHFAEGSDLIPSDAYDRARMLEWLFWEQYSHEPYIAVARYRVKLLGNDVSTLEERLVTRGWAALQRIEDGLAGRDFLVGDALSLADVALIAYTRVAHEGGFSLDAYPKVSAWIARTEAGLRIA